MTELILLLQEMEEKAATVLLAMPSVDQLSQQTLHQWINWWSSERLHWSYWRMWQAIAWIPVQRQFHYSQSRSSWPPVLDLLTEILAREERLLQKAIAAAMRIRLGGYKSMPLFRRPYTLTDWNRWKLKTNWACRETARLFEVFFSFSSWEIKGKVTRWFAVILVEEHQLRDIYFVRITTNHRMEPCDRINFIVWYV